MRPEAAPLLQAQPKARTGMAASGSHPLGPCLQSGLVSPSCPSPSLPPALSTYKAWRHLLGFCQEKSAPLQFHPTCAKPEPQKPGQASGSLQVGPGGARLHCSPQPALGAPSEIRKDFLHQLKQGWEHSSTYPGQFPAWHWREGGAPASQTTALPLPHSDPPRGRKRRMCMRWSLTFSRRGGPLLAETGSSWRSSELAVPLTRTSSTRMARPGMVKPNSCRYLRGQSTMWATADAQKQEGAGCGGGAH